MQKQNISIPFAIIIAGFLIAAALIINNRFSGSEIPNTASLEDSIAEENQADSVDKSKTNLFNVDSEDNIRGDIEALITIVEFSDFQCPYCSSFHNTMTKVMEDYPDKVRWVYKHFPLDSIHPYARKAAEASECAAEQGNFWEYSDVLFSQQSKINLPFLKEAAVEIGLDVDKFNVCLESDKYASKVEQDYQEGLKSGVRGTPGSFINGQELGGAVPYEKLKTIIESLL